MTTTTFTAAPSLLLDRAAATVRNWREAHALRRRYNATLDELNRLGEAELRDLGMNRYDLPRIAREAVYGA